jgi:diguanylate cyclase (GGDEF)-like protein
VIQRFLRFFEQRSKRTLAAFAIVFAILVGWLDLKSGVEIHFTLIYLAPILLTSWYISRAVGVYLALFSSLVWLVADLLGGRSYSSWWISFWNLVMRTGVFIAFALTQSQLRAKFEVLKDLAGRDFLTGLPNGRAFYTLTAKEIDRAFGLEPLTLVSIDIGGLKWVNHRFGYAAGDQMICTIAHAIRQHVPRPDLVGRLGGTAFAALLPNTASDAANLILEKVQNALKEERRKYAHPLTFFISAIACTKAPRTVAELMHEAETQMTRMKGGKNDSVQITQVDSLPVLN